MPTEFAEIMSLEAAGLLSGILPVRQNVVVESANFIKVT
jgi:hypothetical protein